MAQRIHSHLQSGCRDNGQHKETLVFLQESQESEFRAGVTYCWEEKEDRSAALRKSIGSRFPFKRLSPQSACEACKIKSAHTDLIEATEDEKVQNRVRNAFPRVEKATMT